MNRVILLLTLVVTLGGCADGIGQNVVFTHAPTPQPTPPSAPPPEPDPEVGDVFFAYIKQPNLPGFRSGILTFEDEQGGVVERAVPSSDFTELGVASGLQRWPAVHPIDDKVAYVGTAAFDAGGGGSAIYVVPYSAPVGNDEQQDAADVLINFDQFNDGPLKHLAWSPNGEWLACTNGSNIELVQEFGQVRQTLFPNPSNFDFDYHPAWGPDTNPAPGYQGKIYFIHSNQAGSDIQLQCVEVDAGAISFTIGDVETLLTDADLPPLAGFDAPAISPDGTQIAFIAAITVPLFVGKRRVYVADLDVLESATKLAERVTDEDVGQEDSGDDDPVWWDEDTILFGRRLGPFDAETASVLHRIDLGSGTVPSRLVPSDGLLPGASLHPAVVPEDLR